MGFNPWEWAITWIAVAFCYFWPYAVLQGSARMAVGIPWLVVSVIGTLAYLYWRKPSRPNWEKKYEEHDRRRREGYRED